MYLLAGTPIKSPNSMSVSNDTQMAQNRTLGGSITRDFFGSNKRVWQLEYENATKDQFDTINAVYLSYLSTGTAQTFEVTETNYTISSTNVHVDLKERGFTVGGADYISSFTLTLTEA